MKQSLTLSSTRRSRALATLFRADEKPTPVAMTWAATIARTVDDRKAAIRAAAAAIAGAADVKVEFELVRREFLSDLPRPDAVPDHPEREAMSARPAARKGDGGPATFPVPGQDHGAETTEPGAPIKPAGGADDRLSVDEMTTACEVLAAATLHTAKLSDACARAALKLRLLTMTMPDLSARGRLVSGCNALASAARAAGSDPLPVTASQKMQRREIEAAIIGGADVHEVNAIAAAGKEYDALIASGHQMRATREAFIGQALNRGRTSDFYMSPTSRKTR